MKIRTIQPVDYQAVDQLIRESFTQSELGYHDEAELVRALRNEVSYQSDFEVVAEENSVIIGYGGLSEVHVGTSAKVGLCLAPLAIATSHQKQGIGQAIIAELEQRAKQNYGFISILGHPTYYAKFGYVPASQYGIKAPFDVPDEVFMVKEIKPNGLRQVHGLLTYVAAFGI